MVFTIDKEVLILEGDPNAIQEQRKRKNKWTLLISLSIFIAILTSLSIGFWYLHKKRGGSYKISGNDSFTTPEIDTTTEENPSCSLVHDDEKFDCYPNTQPSEEQCVKVGCCYQKPGTTHAAFHPSLIPICYYPPDYVGYYLKNSTIFSEKSTLSITAELERTKPSSFPNDIPSLNLLIQSIDESSLQVKIYDPENSRHEAPLNKKIAYKKVAIKDLLYNIKLFTNGTFIVQRKSSGKVILQVNFQQLIFADQFLQLSTLLPTKFIYGLGEHYDHLLKDVNWTRTPLFNRDNWPKEKVLLYGTHPFYLALEEESNSHGVFFLNSNSMDFTLQPAPALTFRSIGGIIDIFIFLGPTPSKVVQQYTDLVSHPFMPPYWSLGFHLCRYEYNSLDETKKIWLRNRNADLPFDTQWNDIDYMQNHNDFTYNQVKFEGLPDFVNDLHQIGMHYVMIIDPGIPNSEKPGTYPPYDDGVDMNIFVKNSSGDLFIGKVWNTGNTVYPDFSHPNASEYWNKQFKRFHDIIPFDGAWIDMNEPANFYDGQIDGCPNTTLDNPPYTPGGLELLRVHTLCMSAKHFNTSHYNEHSLYAYREAKATFYALSNITMNKKRPFIISRASFAGQGYWSGHWSGDIGSSWEDLRYSVHVLLKFSLYGMPMMGSDICGFRDDTTVELCARWSAVGAFYPFSRNHNDKGQMDQDPAGLGGIVLAAAKSTLTTRYELLPYLYYLFYRSHVYGETVARPLFFEFVNDPNTYSIDEQFLWGSSLMIIPALYPGIKTLQAYFPDDIWYNYYTGEKLDYGGKYVTLDAPLDSINLALRGGYLIAHQHSNTTTTFSRKNKFYLIAGLDQNGKAEGELYWDDGESLGSYEAGLFNLVEFKLQENKLVSKISNSGYSIKMMLDFVKVCGFSSAPETVFLDEKKVEFVFNKYKCLQVTMNVSLMQSFTLEWK